MNSLSNLESVNYSANAEIDKIGSAIGNSLSQIAEGEQMGFFERLFKENNDVIGINGAEVPNIKAALTTYVNSINDKLKEINASVSTENAFRGKYAEATRQFVKSISAACTALTSQLLNFNDELDRVKATFEAKSLSMATNINIVSDDINKAAGGQATSSTSTEQKSTQNVSAPANSGVSASMANPNLNISTPTIAPVIPAIPTSNLSNQATSNSTPEKKVGVTPFALPSLFSGFSALADNGASNNNSNNDHSNFKQQMIDDQVNSKVQNSEQKENLAERETPKAELKEQPAVRTAVPREEEKPVIRASTQSEEVEKDPVRATAQDEQEQPAARTIAPREEEQPAERTAVPREEEKPVVRASTQSEETETPKVDSSEQGSKLKYDDPYNVTSNPLTRSSGVAYYNGHKETYYSQEVLPGGGLNELNNNGRHVASDGTIRDGDGYIAVAADLSIYPMGTIVMTSLGPAKVYDTGVSGQHIDIYVSTRNGW